MPVPAPEGEGGLRRRRPAGLARGEDQGLRRAEGGRGGHRRRAPGALPVPSGTIQGAQAGGVPEGAPEDPGGQGLAPRAARRGTETGVCAALNKGVNPWHTYYILQCRLTRLSCIGIGASKCLRISPIRITGRESGRRL